MYQSIVSQNVSNVLKSLLMHVYISIGLNFVLQSGVCFINEKCYINGEPNPDDETQACDVSKPNEWSTKGREKSIVARADI